MKREGHEHYFAQTRIVMPSYEEALSLLEQRQDQEDLEPGKVVPLKAQEESLLVEHNLTTIYSRTEGIY